MDIVLIGMPGCGKTTIGKYLARKTGMMLVDMDKEIELAEKRKISDIFSSDGEEYFRKCETKCLTGILGKNRIISTGGGIVVTEENHCILKDANCPIVFIDRPIENIMGDVRTSTRPLLKDGRERLLKLYSERYDKYISLCNIRVENTGTIEDAVQKIADEVRNYENNDN